jgi:6-pyruvoyltetrahydropterin/6-carboxytetrahydropterin synthase
MARFAIVLAKADFKFSAAHFTIFDGGRAELLHGHNYRVRVEIEGAELDEQGLLVSIADLKTVIRGACRSLDERVLVPTRAAQLAVRRAAAEVEIGFAGRLYRLPAADVVELPLANTSIELLAQWLWGEIAPAVGDPRLDLLHVAVEETEGQSCRFSAPLRR